MIEFGVYGVQITFLQHSGVKRTNYLEHMDWDWTSYTTIPPLILKKSIQQFTTGIAKD